MKHETGNVAGRATERKGDTMMSKKHLSQGRTRTMLVTKQGQNECMLSTIAAITGHPVEETRLVACKAAGVRTWNGLFRRRDAPARYRAGVIAACAAADPTGRALRMVGRSPSGWSFGAVPAGEPVHGVEVVHPAARGAVVLPLGHYGTVTIRCSPKAHIAPWKDGVVYDPNHPNQPVTLTEFLERAGEGWAVDFLTMAPNGEPEG